MTLLGRQVPDRGPQLMFTDAEPGNRIMWHGQTRLTSAALDHGIGFEAGRRHALRGAEWHVAMQSYHDTVELASSPRSVRTGGISSAVAPPRRLPPM